MATDLPMLASPSTGSTGRNPVVLADLLATGDWWQDTKLDGVRAFLRDGKVFNRKGADVTYKFPEVTGPTGIWLDGEIVAHDGSFETTLMRESQENRATIKRLAESTPCRFVAFDLPNFPRLPWLKRRLMLESIQEHVTVTPISTEPTFFQSVADLGMEGVIAKRTASRYQYGKRSKDWIKFKHLHRVSCLIAGYTPGSGSREHFGALVLGLLDPTGTVVPVGRCGSGFTERQTHDLKARLDAGELLVAEIETVNVTSGNTLRFPVFRGLRTDLAPTACSTDQLATLPRC